MSVGVRVVSTETKGLLQASEHLQPILSPSSPLPRASVRETTQQRTGSAGMGIEATETEGQDRDEDVRCTLENPRQNRSRYSFTVPGSQLPSWFEMEDDLGIG